MVKGVKIHTTQAYNNNTHELEDVYTANPHLRDPSYLLQCPSLLGTPFFPNFCSLHSAVSLFCP